MRIPLALLLGLSAYVAVSAAAQNTVSSSSDATTVSSQAVQAFSSPPLAQIQLTGAAKAYAGSLQPSGTFTATLKATGESTLQLDLAELTRTETTGAYSSPPQCQWTGADGVQHDAALHNCFLPVHWLVPVLSLQGQVANLNQSVASATDQGVAVQALSLVAPAADSTASAQRIAQLSSAKLSLDASLMRPTSLSFNVHPDNDGNTNIPIVVRYSDYRQISGASIPFRIQKYLNNGLVLDLTVTTAEVE